MTTMLRAGPRAQAKRQNRAKSTLYQKPKDPKLVALGSKVQELKHFEAQGLKIECAVCGKQRQPKSIAVCPECMRFVCIYGCLDDKAACCTECAGGAAHE